MDRAAQRVATRLAAGILQLARHPSHGVVVKLGGAYSPYYQVGVTVWGSRSTTVGPLSGRYSLYAVFPRPPGSHVGGVYGPDLGRLRAAGVVQVVINGGAQQLTLQRNTYPPYETQYVPAGSQRPPVRVPLDRGWYFHGGYLDQADRFVSIAADTRPHTQRQRRLTAALLAPVASQASRVLADAEARASTVYLSPAFPPQAGEDTAIAPPVV